MGILDDFGNESQEEIKKRMEKTAKLNEGEVDEYEKIIEVYKELSEERGESFSNMNIKEQEKLVDERIQKKEEALKKEIDGMIS